MTMEDFNKLDFDSKLYEVVDYGVFVDNYVTSKVRINCYSLHKFFVELEYDGSENKIINVSAFLDGPQLNKYSK